MNLIIILVEAALEYYYLGATILIHFHQLQPSL
jgi:hypothetical protein